MAGILKRPRGRSASGIPLAAALTLAASLAAPPALAGDGPRWLTQAAPRRMDDALAQAVDEVRRFPQDYGALVRLARAAEAAGEPRLSLAAWEAAEDVSGGNLETAAGQVGAQMAAGHEGRARRAAREAIEMNPEYATAHRQLAWGWYADEGPAPTALRMERAEAALTTAAELDPETPQVWCELGYARLGLGDRPGARLAFSRAGDSCRRAGETLAAPGWQASVGLWATGLRYSGDSPFDGGASGAIAAGLSYDQRLTVRVVGRTLGVRGAAAPGLVEPSVSFNEGWAEVGYQGARRGMSAVVGTVGPDTDGAEATRAAALTAWTGSWIRLSGDVARLSFDDGAAVQGGLGLTVPVTRGLSLAGGARATRFASAEGEVSTSLSPWGEVRYARPGWSAAVGGRGGRELRPVRLDDLTLWDLQDGVGPSGWIQLTATPDADGVLKNTWFSANYEAYSILSDDTGAAVGHAFTLGMTRTFGGSLP